MRPAPILLKSGPLLLLAFFVLAFFILVNKSPADTIAHWRLVSDDGLPADAIVHDVSEAGHDGIMFGSPATREILYPVDGRPVIFDGRDDRVAVPDSPAFELTESLTIECYICVDRYPCLLRLNVLSLRQQLARRQPASCCINSVVIEEATLFATRYTGRAGRASATSATLTLTLTDICAALALPVLESHSTLIRFGNSLLVDNQQAVASMVR
jgi:hypothetical protein